MKTSKPLVIVYILWLLSGAFALLMLLRPLIWPATEDPLEELYTMTMAVPPYDVGFHPVGADTLEMTDRRLALAMSRLMISWSYEAAPSDNVGTLYVVQGGRVIEIATGYDKDTQRLIIAHELGHALQPKLGALEDYGEGEVFAEGVAFLVVRRETREYDMYFADYLGVYKDNLDTLRNYRDEIIAAARFISGE